MIGTSMSNSLIVGYTTNDESRGRHRRPLPVRRHPRRTARPTSSFGSEPFTLQQRAALQHVPAPGQLHEVQQPPLADVRRHDAEVPLGQRVLELLPAERLRLQLAGRLLHRRQRLPGEPEPDDARRSRCAGSRCATATSRTSTSRSSRSTCWYSGGYVQDEWRPRRNLTVTGGPRFDVSAFENTAYPERRRPTR